LDEAGAVKAVLIALVMVVLLSACEQRKPKFTDAQMDEVRVQTPWMTDECLEKMRWGGVTAVTGDCTRRSPPARERGLWRNDFEGSLFCPAPATSCSNGTGGSPIWLDVDSTHAAPKGLVTGGLYAVEFVGRASSHGTSWEAYGYPQDIVVDGMISVRQVEPPPPQPSEAEMMDSMIRDEAAGSFLPNAQTKKQMDDYLRTHPRKNKKQ